MLLLLLLFLLALAASSTSARASPSFPSPPPRLRVAKTEGVDPAFQNWWLADKAAVSAQDDTRLLVDPRVQAKRLELKTLADAFFEEGEEDAADRPPRVAAADGAASSSPSSLSRQHLAPSQWNLDRIDARYPSLDRGYEYNASRAGEGVTIWTVDSGIIAEHDEFACWGEEGKEEGCSRAQEGPSFLSDGSSPSSSRDCDGHGTHVASTAIGRRVGVAKRARVVALRVLDCNGTGTIEDVVSALEYVRLHAKRPAIVTLSLGVPSGPYSEALERAVRDVVLEAQIPVVVASGNSGVDACGVAPARVPEALTVAATDLESKFSGTGLDGVAGGSSGSTAELLSDGRGVPPPHHLLRDTVYPFSNLGRCVDLFSPGVDILAACGGARRCERLGPSAYAWATGTSMAAPHVAGLAAVLLSAHPEATPSEVRRALVGTATRGVLTGGGVGSGGGVAVVGGREAGRGGSRLRASAEGRGARRGGGGDGAEQADDQGVAGLDWSPDLTLYTRAVAAGGEE